MANRDETYTPSSDAKSPTPIRHIDILGGDSLSEAKTAPKLSPQLQKRLKEFGPAIKADKPKVTVMPANLPDSPEIDAQPGAIKLDDDVSDAAIDEIAAREGDELLSAEDSAAKKSSKKKSSNNKFIRIIKRKLTWIIVIILALIVVFSLPVSRYKVLGLVIKKPYTVTVTDSKTLTPVSNATIQFDGQDVKTDAAGKVTLKVPLGYGELSVSKDYYQSYGQRVSVGLGKQPAPLHVTLVATGRQVPVIVDNEVSGQPLAGATIAVLGTTAKTNSSGMATIVLPTRATAFRATISDSGYNTTLSPITVTSNVITSNNFKLTPSGKIYFLSNVTGKINVDSSNLDGSDAQVVLAATGYESSSTTSLYNSNDWKYLMLMAQRTANPSDSGLYLINTASNDALTTVSAGDNSYTPIGWSGHYFLYEVNNLSLSVYQPSQYLLMSYDADTGKSTTLDQSNATGNANDYASQYFTNFYIVNGKLIYSKLWTGDSDNYSSNSFVSSINTINPDGTGQSPLQQFTMTQDNLTNIDYMASTMFAANEIYFEANIGDGSTQFYSYDNGAITQPSLTSAQFNAVNYITGILSPSGSMAAFPSTRNGQFALLTGTPTSSASTQHVIATLSSDYSFYGWYNNSYIILSYNNADLYIIPASGLSAKQQPVKISGFLSEPNDSVQ
jgi:hypothetical protein